MIITVVPMLIEIDREISFVEQETEEIEKLRAQGKSDDEIRMMGFKDLETTPDVNPV